MDSNDSDDEPLAVIAAAKKKDPEKFSSENLVYEPKRKKRKPAICTKESPFKKLPLTIKLSRNLPNQVSSVVERSPEVWLYLKDLKPAGPYTCLLCSEWFINRSKIVLHYMLNHKKDFCGICKYFLLDKEAWERHQDTHSPWPCSQCVNNFGSEADLRHHFSDAHGMVHCRLCHFRLTDDQYTSHLHKKHNVINADIETEMLWKSKETDSKYFTCLLCSKTNLDSKGFFNHYMGYHRFTLQCFTSVLSGTNTNITVPGIDVSTEFIRRLQGQKFGYVDVDQIKAEPSEAEFEKPYPQDNQPRPLIGEFIQMKEEVFSDAEDGNTKEAPGMETVIYRDKRELVRTYKGDIDFDVTLMEFIMLDKFYFDYVHETLNIINSNNVPDNSDVCYEDTKIDHRIDVTCGLCHSNYQTVQAFTIHMHKMHMLKSVPVFSCRVCVATFDTLQELKNHVSEELGEFEDLWICQFCDKEFEDRQNSRKHLKEHLDIIEADNCFSPHIGFKCKYCPTLFWNETERETHQVKTHFSKYRKYYYTCKVDDCSDIFSDKVWFIHHYLEKHFKGTECYLVKCCLCSLVLPNEDEMRSHFKAEHPDARKVFCSLDSCQYRPLSHKKSFHMHLKTVHSVVETAPRDFPCRECGRIFATSRSLSAHAANVHYKAKLHCKICNQTLKSNDERKLHYLLQHPGQHPFECKVCGKSFQYKSTLYMHKQEHAPNRQPFTCSFCHKVFAKKDSFREHMAIHTGPRHACSYCPMRFVQRSNMVRHERRHTGERPYVCPHCPRTFADKGACTSHAKTHTEKTPFVCMYCGKTFAQKSKLTYHTRRHTGENLESCPVCSKVFTSGCSLREHMKIHDPNKKTNVPCPICGRRYQDERYMLRHLRTSHSFRRYDCPLCDKALTSISGLRHHVITHSKLNLFRCNRCPKSFNVRRSMLKHLKKRHGLKMNNEKLKEFYTKLDPSECQLPLDQETMKSIFGPTQRVDNDLVANSTDNPNTSNSTDKTEGNENVTGSESGNEVETSGSNEEEREDPDDSKEMNEDEGSNGENALEPSDFVTVKIEPMDEDEV